MDDCCIICYGRNTKQVNYFKCSKYHNLCGICFNMHINSTNTNSDKCPICKAGLSNECKNPYTLSEYDLYHLDVKNILQRHIFIHQNFALNPSYYPAFIKFGSEKISLFMDNGVPALYLGMFIATNGFFYDYSKKTKCYILSISKQRYQFWDNSRVQIV